MPPKSRRRSWRAISSVASKLVFRMVSARPVLPVNLPELTSMATSASVWSTTREPPEGRGTLRRSRRSMSSSILKCSKIGFSPS